MKFQAFHVNPGEKLKKEDVNNNLSNFMSVFPSRDVSQQIWKSDKHLLLPTPNDGRALLTRQFWKPIQSCIGDSWPPIYHNQKLQDNNNESMRKMLNRLTNWRKNSSHWYSEKKILDEIMIIFYTAITYSWFIEKSEKFHSSSFRVKILV